MSARIFPSVGRYYKTDTYVERSYSGKRNNLLPVAEGLNATLYIKKNASSCRGGDFALRVKQTWRTE